MAARNLHLYSLNEGIAYPLDDSATLASDAGPLLPSGLLVDLLIRWPDTAGRYAFLSSATVTPNVVSITILAATSPEDTASFAPLAVVALPQPVAPGVQVALRPQRAGVGGWVVFGGAVLDRAFVGRFSTPRQGLLLARAARAYPPPPVTALVLPGVAAPLAGLVPLRVTAPLKASVEARTIAGLERTCVVFSLAGEGAGGGFPTPAAAARLTGYRAPHPLVAYAGPCAGRPESGTCGPPEPVETINTVAPDCDGVVTVAFSGCAALTPLDDGHGVLVDCALGLATSCPPPDLPDAAGALPGVPAGGPVVPPPLEPPASESLPTLIVSEPLGGGGGGTAFASCFYGGVEPHLSPALGAWDVERDRTDAFRPCAADAILVSESLSGSVPVYGPPAEYAYAAASAAGPNVALLEVGDFTTMGRRFIAYVKLLYGPAGARHNAAIVVNFRPHPDVPGRVVYHAAVLDHDAQELRIEWFDGVATHVLAAAALAGSSLDAWYALAVTTALDGRGRATLAATVDSLADHAIGRALGPIASDTFFPSDGHFGLGTDRALSRFSWINLEAL